MGDETSGKIQHLFTAVWQPTRRYEISKRQMMLLAAVIVACLLAAAWLTVRDVSRGQHRASNVIPTSPEASTPKGTFVQQSSPPSAAVSTSVSSSSHGAGSSTPAANVTVNGHSVPVPENGTVKRTVKASNGDTTNVTIRHSSTSSSSGSSSTNLYVSTRSTSVTENGGTKDP